MPTYSNIRYVSSGGGGGGSGVTTYSSYSAFPAASEASNGDLAFADDTGALYVFDGSEWDRIAAGSDETPVITTDPASSHTLNNDGSTSTVTMVAEDPEGFDIEYGIAYKTSESRGLGSNGLPVQITGTSINQSTGVYTFTPSTTTGDAGSFTARLSASDGVKTTTRNVAVDLSFYPIEDSAITAQYHFYDTNSYDPATSTTALYDLSGNSNTMTITSPGSSTTAGGVTAFEVTTSTRFNFNTISADTKSFAIFFYPPTGFNTTVLIGNGVNYRHTFSSSQSADYGGGFSAWSNATVFDRVNGFNPNNNRQTAYNRLTLNEYNSVISNGVNYSNVFELNGYTGGWTGAYHIRAILMFNRFITTTEAEALHDYYQTNITDAGGTMGDWGV